MEKRQIILAAVLLFSVTIYFLPWFTSYISFNSAAYTETIYGYCYVVPIVTSYNVPVGVLCIIGSVLSAISFKRTQSFQLYNLVGGILILIGIISSFMYTFSVAASEVPPGNMLWSVNVWAEYGAGLMFLSGFLIAIIGAFQNLYGVLRGLYIQMKPLVKIGVCVAGIACLIIGLAFVAISIYGLIGGNVQFIVQATVVSPEEGAKIFLIIGMIILGIGALATFEGFKKIK